MEGPGCALLLESVLTTAAQRRKEAAWKGATSLVVGEATCKQDPGDPGRRRGASPYRRVQMGCRALAHQE